MGDQYADILGVDHSGSLSLVDNTLRRFTRSEIQVNSGNVPTRVSQYKIYDMDADSRDDIVYLTE